MTEFFQALKDAFPPLAHHPVLMARVLILLLVLVALYSPKELRRRICHFLCSKLNEQIFATTRWLFFYKNSQMVSNWKHYTSESSGKTGDDVLWTLVHWPSLKPKDSFKVTGAVGMLSGIHDSEAKLYARWDIVHNPDSCIGPVPARGLVSKLRRAAAKTLHILGTI